MSGTFAPAGEATPGTHIEDTLGATASGSIVADSMLEVVGHLASAIKRIHGGDDFSGNAAGIFTGNINVGDTGTFLKQDGDGKLLISSDGNAEDAILIEADGGANETIRIHSDQGTGVNAKGGTKDASISMDSDDGGIGLYSGLNNDNAITLETNGGANETIQIRSNQGEGVATADIANAVNASIALISDAGGVGIFSGLNGEGAVYIGADAGANETVRIHSNQGTGVNAKGGSTDASVNIVSDVGGIGLYTALDADNAITLEANGGGDETIQVRSNQGTGVATADIANAVNASIALVSDVGGVAAVSGLDGAGAIWIGADAGTSETVVVHSHQGTGADSIKIYSDAGGVTIDGGSTAEGIKLGTTSGAPIVIGHATSETTVSDNLTVTGNATISGDHTIAGSLIVQGSTTTVSSSSDSCWGR